MGLLLVLLFVRVYVCEGGRQRERACVYVGVGGEEGEEICSGSIAAS